ncbi:hypothetical protein CEXT_629791 [Caerostris extrusa]|uniref:Uncharacterized protein n=1 Tax=Caerostris extrusa TaxID=172846 RepID=A0AAV4V3B9_CAEEX|nr:hypothetical protein CEXT_629791 [Caerostris extrusa]
MLIGWQNTPGIRTVIYFPGNNHSFSQSSRRPRALLIHQLSKQTAAKVNAALNSNYSHGHIHGLLEPRRSLDVSFVVTITCLVLKLSTNNGPILLNNK